MTLTSVHTDTFGNEIDPVMGFARGRILRSATDESLRLRHAQQVAAARVMRYGPNSIGIFTGNKRDFLIKNDDIATLCEEWVGPGIFADDLRRVILEHVGGDSSHDVATFNRTSAAIIATIVALSDSTSVLSVVPTAGASHASVSRGAKLAGVSVEHCQIQEDWEEALERLRPKLVIVTTVTSSLERLTDTDIVAVVKAARTQGARVLLDEAYGARLRPALYEGAESLALGADLTVTNCDKAGLSGPRAGIFAGRPDLVAEVSAVAAGFGMEARAPISAGVLRALEAYSPEELQNEAREGAELTEALATQFNGDIVRPTALGPMIHEDDVLREALRRAGRSDASVVPCEASAALGMILLDRHGVLTVNTHGQPGARVSLRLKPTPGAIAAIGGVEQTTNAVVSGFEELARVIDDPERVRSLILGARK